MNSTVKTLLILAVLVLVLGGAAFLFINRARLRAPQATPTPGPLEGTPQPTLLPFPSITPFPLLILPTGTVRPTLTPVATATGNTTTQCQYLTTSPSEGTAPLSVRFTATGFGAAASSIREYEFSFGEASGTPVRQQSATATHRYDKEGTYQATVKVRDAQGNVIPVTGISGECRRSVTVRAVPTASGTPTPTSNLPKTGPEGTLMLLLVPTALLGLYLYRHFRLI